MKSILVIGISRFGAHLCRNLVAQKNQLMIIDKNEQALEDITPLVSSALIADCTRKDVLESVGVSDFDICFVCISDNFQASLEITSLLKEVGAKYVVSVSRRDVHTKFLLRNGADEVINPDKEMSERCAIMYSNDNIFDYIELEQDYSIYEIRPMKEWVGKSLRESDIRAKHKISVIGIVNKDGELNITPSPDQPINADDHLMVIAHKDDIKKVVK